MDDKNKQSSTMLYLAVVVLKTVSWSWFWEHRTVVCAESGKFVSTGARRSKRFVGGRPSLLYTLVRVDCVMYRRQDETTRLYSYMYSKQVPVDGCEGMYTLYSPSTSDHHLSRSRIQEAKIEATLQSFNLGTAMLSFKVIVWRRSL